MNTGAHRRRLRGRRHAAGGQPCRSGHRTGPESGLRIKPISVHESGASPSPTSRGAGCGFVDDALRAPAILSDCQHPRPTSWVAIPIRRNQACLRAKEARPVPRRTVLEARLTAAATGPGRATRNEAFLNGPASITLANQWETICAVLCGHWCPADAVCGRARQHRPCLFAARLALPPCAVREGGARRRYVVAGLCEHRLKRRVTNASGRESAGNDPGLPGVFAAGRPARIHVVCTCHRGRGTRAIASKFSVVRH